MASAYLMDVERGEQVLALAAASVQHSLRLAFQTPDVSEQALQIVLQSVNATRPALTCMMTVL